MIKIENVETFGWETAIRGMRNPMNSWDKSDSEFNVTTYWDDECTMEYEHYDVIIGNNDLKLMKKLSRAGNDHGKFLRMINVTMDIVAPLYWWKEFDTYKVGTVANSCSTMHKIQAKEFTLDDFSHEHLLDLGALCSSTSSLKLLISKLNFWRNRHNESDEERTKYFNYNGYPSVPTKKECWWQMIQLLPSSYNQRRTVQLNYAVLKNMYHSRKNHKLDEWLEFCKWVESLPYSHELIVGDN